MVWVGAGASQGGGAAQRGRQAFWAWAWPFVCPPHPRGVQMCSASADGGKEAMLR